MLGPANLVSLAAAGVLRSRALAVAAGLTAVGQALYVVGGLRFAGAPGSIYRALSAAPDLVAHKLSLFARIYRGRGTEEWLRTTLKASGLNFDADSSEAPAAAPAVFRKFRRENWKSDMALSEVASPDTRYNR